MMAKDPSVNSYSKVVSGICATVVAAMILWLCSASYSASIRLSVLESQFNSIQIMLNELKSDSKANRAMLFEIRSRIPPTKHVQDSQDNK